MLSLRSEKWGGGGGWVGGGGGGGRASPRRTPFDAHGVHYQQLSIGRIIITCFSYSWSSPFPALKMSTITRWPLQTDQSTWITPI